MTPLEQARALSALGFSVIPVPRPDPARGHDGKTPVIRWRPYQQRRPTEAEIEAMFGGAAMNLAIITGAISDVVVVDLDGPDARRWWTQRRPFTPWQVRTSRGFHCYYRHPGVHVANRIRACGQAIDVRGDGGYVIGPGSVHASGAEYEMAGDWTAPREAVPRFWPGWIARPDRPPPPSRPPSTSRDRLARARAYLRAIPRPEIGMGSDAATLYAACRLVRGFGLPAADAEALLWEWAGGRPGWTRDWVARKVQHAARYGTEPIGGLVS